MVQKSEDKQRAGPPSWLAAEWCRIIEGNPQGLCLFRFGTFKATVIKIDFGHLDHMLLWE